MITRRKVNTEIQSLTYLQSMTLAYEEIAAMRMRRIKDSVLHNRRFLSGLTDVFRSVEYSYDKEIKKLMRKGKEGVGFYVKPKKERTVAVLLSSNTGLYGDIVTRTFQEFAQYIVSNDVDAVVVGRLGRSAFESRKSKVACTYFDLSDSVQDPDMVEKILMHIEQYETVIVFHGKFKDILNQTPTRTYVTGQDLALKPTERAGPVKCLFEPSLKDVLIFFETQIFSALFEQTLYESSLSKFTSRMVSLDSASMNITSRLRKTNLVKKALKHVEYNKKQSNTLAGISFWGS